MIFWILAGLYSRLKNAQNDTQDRIPEMMFLAEAFENLKDWVVTFCSESLSRYPATGKDYCQTWMEKMLSRCSPVRV